MGLWRFLQAELLVHPLLSLQEGILVNCWEGIPQQLQLGAGWGRNPPAAPWSCIAAAPSQGTQSTGRKKVAGTTWRGKIQQNLEMGRCSLASNSLHSPEWRHLCLGLGGQRALQQEWNNSFKCDPFESSLGSEHPSGSSLASPPAGKILWMMICSGASPKELPLRPRIKQGAERHWSLP